jgi:hypothetical protein
LEFDNQADLDGDGDDDYIIGNSGNNTFFKASYDQPLQMYVNDFDRNGNIDQIITSYKNGKSYPVRYERRFDKTDSVFTKKISQIFLVRRVKQSTIYFQKKH